MRYEAKHNYLKKMAQNVGNYISISWTLAMRHQYLQCSGDNLLYSDWSRYAVHIQYLCYRNTILGDTVATCNRANGGD